DERRALERIAKRRRLRAGDFVYTQGDAVEYFYIVESGRVRVFYQTPAGREPTVTYRGPGDLFGISSLAGGDRRVPSAQALEPSVIWAIAHQDLDVLTRRLPPLASGIIKALALRLRDIMVLVESVATWPARLRVANFLLATRGRPGTAGAAGWTHGGLAEPLGGARQTGAQALNQVARAGWVRAARKRIFVMDYRALERLVGTTSAPTPERSFRRHEPHESS